MKLAAYIFFVLCSLHSLAVVKNDTIPAGFIGDEKALAKYVRANLLNLKSMRADMNGCGVYILVSLNEKSKVVDTRQTPQSSVCEDHVKNELNVLLTRSGQWKAKTAHGKAFASQLFYHFQFWKDSVFVEKVDLSHVNEMMTITREGEDPSSSSPAQASETEVYTIVEEMAEFPGGISEMSTYIREHLVYPKTAEEKKISGKCFVKFVVSSSGKVTKVEILKGVPDCPECDKAALDVVRGMPDWKPARMSGRNVNMYYNLPINFRPNN